MSKVVIEDSIQKISREEWDSLNRENNPFISWSFFKSLELGNCLGPTTGWNPLYFALYEQDQLIGAIPVFLKTDSYGEFIFDWQWAQAYQRYGIDYYPKLTIAIPYSPISAPKILGDILQVKEILFPHLIGFYHQNDLSSIHFLFTQEQEDELYKDHNFLERDSIQYHWSRNNSLSFEDYLGRLKKNRRKSIKRERRELSHLSFKKVSGNEISSDNLEFFYQCYLNTIDKKWSQAYLSLEFFKSFLELESDHTTLVIAFEDDTAIACALYFHSSKKLYGRYWGAIENIPFLHFEMCIYQGIEICIEKKLDVFEAGAQGEHKRIRGFPPILTKSWHHLKNEDFNQAVAQFLKDERQVLRSVFTP